MVDRGEEGRKRWKIKQLQIKVGPPSSRDLTQLNCPEFFRESHDALLHSLCL